jgi:hypothetical protein
MLFALLGVSFKVSKSIDVTYSFAKESRLSIVGTTNVAGFGCVSHELSSVLRATVYPDDAGTDIAFKNAVLNVGVDLLDCGNSKMNKDLCRALQSGKYPYITICLSSIKSTGKADGIATEWIEFIARITITTAGVSQPASVLFRATKLDESQLRITGQHTLLLSSFGIKPPTALLGAVKVRDAITIKFDLLMSMRIIV